MCGGHHHHGRRGRGYPSREQWVERLEAFREQLQADLVNVDDLLARLRDEGAKPPTI